MKFFTGRKQESTGRHPAQQTGGGNSARALVDNRPSSVLQQKHFPATSQLKGKVNINDDASLEKEADKMGAMAMNTGPGNSVQRVSSFLPSSAGTKTVQGKWFRMSSILTEEDTQIVEKIQQLANEGQYLEAFQVVIEPYESLQQDLRVIVYLAEKYGRMDEVTGLLHRTFTSGGKAYTAGEIIEELDALFEEQKLHDEEFHEEVGAEPLSPQERGHLAIEEIMQLTQQVNDTEELMQQMSPIAEKYGITEYHLDTEKHPAVLMFRINPQFQIVLGGGHAIEMRSEGSGGAVQTKVRWQPQKLTLSTIAHPGGGTYTVGKNMLANPLSQDHPAGTIANADSDHDGLMGKLPSKGNRKKTGSGSGPYFFIKGHLLNDNLGGIANEANLFPITHEANGQHKNYVEQYIKKGIGEGYVYRYEVDIQNIAVDYDNGLNLYSVDSDIAFSFARLDTSLNDVPGTVHNGRIQSRYENVGAQPFDKSTEYSKDYGGSYNHPVKVGTEAVSKSTEKTPLGSNSGLFSHVSAFTMGLPSGSSAFSGGSGGGMSISTSAALVPSGKLLSLRKSNITSVENYFAQLVNGWSKTDITGWITDVRGNNLSSWARVWDSATTSFNLDPAVAANITSGGYLVRVSINGKATGT
ncbi:MAG TPA: hypothetical protein VFU15_03230 [Bacteroidia bacterium]|nr:hypothetical protein [Bacteroidia bacterium]